MLFFISLAFFFPLPPWMRKVGWIAALIFISLLAFIILILISKEITHKILRKMMFLTSEDIQEKVLNMFNWFSEGLGVIKNSGNMIPFLLSSIIIWILEGLIIFTFIRSLNIDAPIISGYFVMIMFGFGIALPSAPGYIGVYQFMCIKALSIWGISESISLSFALIMQAATFIPMNIIGIILFYVKFSERNHQF